MKIKLLLLVLLSCLYFSGICGNLTLQAKPNDGIKFTSNEVWELNIISTYTQQFNAILSAEIVNSDGIPVARMISNPVVIRSGANTYSSFNVSIGSFTYVNDDFGNYEVRNGFLPAGDYEYCITVSCADAHCREVYLTEIEDKICVDIIGIVPSPLLLSMPQDDAELKETRPNFNWIPPMPIGSDPQINYEFILVRLKENQSGENAIRRNRAMYQTSGITQLNIAFPAELDDLIPGEKYAWQVKALLGKTVVQTSEVWEFEIEKVELEVSPMPYVMLKHETYPVFSAVRTANFVYEEANNVGEISVTIFDSKGNKLTDSNIKLNTVQGTNHFAFDLTPFDLNQQEVYKLKISNSKGEVYEILVRYYHMDN